VLAVGYMAESRVEAQRVFRKIYAVLVVENSFKEKIAEFIKKYADRAGRGLYVLFKKELLNRYAVPKNLYKAQEEGELKSLADRDFIESLFESNELKGLSGREKELWQKRLKRWLQGVYILQRSSESFV
ncbi:MAG: hypothetical protein GXO03_04415, partial [Aquificae bacterium]|nr:hypothetical protein [Aquificota bacterium]